MENLQEFENTLVKAASVLNSYHSEWMVIGGAALKLHGFPIKLMRDVDIVISNETALKIADQFSISNQSDSLSKKFKSDVLLRPNFGSVKVELMANFRIHTSNGWVCIEPVDFQKVIIKNHFVNLASRLQLKSIFELGGRKKDIKRAQLLK